MVLQYFASGIRGGVIISTVSTFVLGVISLVVTAFTIMVSATVTTDLGVVVLQRAVTLCVSELLTSITLSHVISVGHTASAEVNENLEVQ